MYWRLILRYVKQPTKEADKTNVSGKVSGEQTSYVHMTVLCLSHLLTVTVQCTGLCLASAPAKYLNIPLNYYLHS